MKNSKFRILRLIPTLFLILLSLFSFPKDAHALFGARGGFRIRKPRISRPLLPFHHKRARPGEPVTLEGKGAAFAHGQGNLSLKIEKGGLVVLGKGVVAVRGDPQVFTRGFGKKKEVGGWRFYAGRGVLRVKGEEFSLSCWGKLRALAKGEGKITLRGWWGVWYRGFGQGESHLEPEVALPEELKEETE